MVTSPKYIFISGGVISGLGKGATISMMGAIMKACGYNVTALKIDPYLNIDAGTFSPYEHGEVFVLDDGAEVDLDLGNYERMLDVRLTKYNNITTGKIYNNVIRKEREGKYLGKTVQIIPHITDEIQDWIKGLPRIPVDDDKLPQICLIEIGGVVGDIESMPFIEAIRQFQNKLGNQNYCNIHVSLLPETCGGEMKTKPTQNSVRIMRSFGLTPDFIFCRATKDLTEDIKDKISLFCDVTSDKVISLPDLQSIYQIIPKLHSQKITSLVSQRLCLPVPNVDNPLLLPLLEFAQKSVNSFLETKICIIGKYVNHSDAYHSIEAALIHTGLFYERKIKINWIYSDKLERNESNQKEYEDSWEKLRSSDGIIIPGGFDKRGISGKLLAVKYAREAKKPILGICLGLQVMIIELSRNVLGLSDANSSEFDPESKNQVIIEMPEFNPSQKGGTMRLGLRKTIIKTKQSHAARLYQGQESVFERHRHRYEFNMDYKQALEDSGLRFVGEDETGKRMEIIELPENIHPYFVGVQYHPEFLSRPLSPSPPFKGLIESAIKIQNSLNLL